MVRPKKDYDWKVLGQDMTKKGLMNSLRAKREYSLAKDQYTTTLYDDFLALSLAIRDRLVERWIHTQERYHSENVKRVYYLSMEFLTGRLLGNNIINLDLLKEANEALRDLELDLGEIREQETDAGLGNGGLGRLAACFLDSLATMGIPAQGYGIRYEYGIFHQKIIKGYQVEYPDEWLTRVNPWEFERPEYAVKVKFYGNVDAFTGQNGKTYYHWKDTEDVVAMPYDTPVPGYKSDIVNTLRLWSARSSEEFDLRYFNEGDYEKAVYDKVYSENISKVLYPNDNMVEGRELRLKQEYFFTAASVWDIVRRFKKENKDFKTFPDKAQIQINETHPGLAIVELFRILIDKEGLEWDAAWDIVTKTFAYTNHTVMPEALERWSVDIFGKMLPRHLQLIYEINLKFLEDVALRFPGDNERLARMSIIEESSPKKIRMANLCIIGSHSVNGVSELHTNIIKTELFKDFYEFCPEKFNNKTNGITQRRWLQKANTRLSDLITESIGDKWPTNLYELKKLAPLAENASFCGRWQSIKDENKKILADYIFNTTKIKVNPDSLFDVQVKRIHEYKRQLLFCFYIISEYLKLKDGPKPDVLPRTFILGGKAAPAYSMAKLIIKFINSIAEIINKDKSVRDLLKVVFLENYRVSLAEKIIPASELSEQISTAGTEASGTGCMKFMLNGALTIGTLDGANIEIAEEVGKENMFIFGLKADEIHKLRNRGYHPQDFIKASPTLKKILHLIESNFFSPIEFGIFDAIVKHVSSLDTFFIAADFELYLAAQEKVSHAYRDRKKWVKKSILNTASSGKFSSDRAVREYAKDIWNIPVKIK